MNNGTILSNLSGGGAARRRAPPSGDVGQLHRRGRPGRSTFTADYFRIHVSDRIGITSNFTLEDAEIDALLAQGVDAARDLRRFRFFTTAFATRSQGIDPSPAPVDRGGPRAPPPASDNLSRVRT